MIPKKIAAVLAVFVFVLLFFCACTWPFGSSKGRTVVDFEISEASKINYHKGDEPYIVLILSFSDGTKETTTARSAWITGFNSSNPGPQTITVTCGGKNKNHHGNHRRCFPYRYSDYLLPNKNNLRGGRSA